MKSTLKFTFNIFLISTLVHLANHPAIAGGDDGIMDKYESKKLPNTLG